MIQKSQILRNVRVATPCPTSWEAMDGDDRVRFCAACKLNVYNLSDMDSVDAEELVRANEGRRLCIRYYARRDGTVITRDCPVGVRALRRRLATALLSGIALFLSLSAMAAKLGRGTDPEVDFRQSALTTVKERIRQVEPFHTVLNWIDPPQTVTVGKPVSVTVGAVAYRPTAREIVAERVP